MSLIVLSYHRFLLFQSNSGRSRPVWILVHHGSFQRIAAVCRNNCQVFDSQRTEVVSLFPGISVVYFVINCCLPERPEILAVTLRRYVSCTASVCNQFTFSIGVSVTQISFVPKINSFYDVWFGKQTIPGTPSLQVIPAHTFSNEFTASFSADVVKCSIYF